MKRLDRETLITKQAANIDSGAVIGSSYIDAVECVRCGGSGKANPFTHPEQAHCCYLCNGKGKHKVRVYPSGRMF